MHNFSYLTLPLDQNTDNLGTMVCRNDSTDLGPHPKPQVNIRGKMKYCFLFSNLNAFTRVRASVQFVRAHRSATSSGVSTQHSQQLDGFSTHRWKIVWPAGGHVCLCVFAAHACLSEAGQRGVSADFTVTPCGADEQLKLSSWV